MSFFAPHSRFSPPLRPHPSRLRRSTFPTGEGLFCTVHSPLDTNSFFKPPRKPHPSRLRRSTFPRGEGLFCTVHSPLDISTLFKPPRSEEGSRDEIPCRGSRGQRPLTSSAPAPVTSCEAAASQNTPARTAAQPQRPQTCPDNRKESDRKRRRPWK